MKRLTEWTSAVCSELGVDAGEIDRGLVLHLARDSARTVDRPAATITTFILGVAVGRGLPPDEAAARIGELAQRWPAIDWRD